MNSFEKSATAKRRILFLGAMLVLPIFSSVAYSQSVTITFTPPLTTTGSASAAVSPVASGVSTSPVAAVSPAAEAAQTAAPALSPTATAASSATAASASTPGPSATPSLLKTTGVKLQFLPPPMDGTISLGIYDHTGKLVRTLHRAATGDEFVAALDGYITHWDGLDDAGKEMPPGHYSARGYTVNGLNIYPLAVPSNSGSGANLQPFDRKAFTPREKIHLSLMANPLERDRTGIADVIVEIDSTGAAWLALADGLPLKQVSPSGDFDKAEIGRAGDSGPLTVVLSKAGADMQAFTVTKTADMMAFDCGGFDLPGK